MSYEQKRQLNDHQLALLESEMQKRRKSVGLAYVLWIFLGTFGIHKFYTGQKNMGILYLVLTITGIITSFIGIGLFVLAAVGILLLIDLFTLPGQVAKANEAAEAEIINRILADNPQQEGQ